MLLAERVGRGVIMATMSEAPVTLLLRQWQAGNNEAVEQLMPLVYDQLRALARRYMRSERQDHTLRPTAVVHEAFLQLVEADSPFSDRVHFFAVAATVMRHILINWARSHRREKRGGGAVKVELEESSALSWDDPETVIEVDRVLERLAAFDERKAKITEMIFFGGMDLFGDGCLPWHLGGDRAPRTQDGQSLDAP